MNRILLVEDDDALARGLVDTLRLEGYEVDRVGEAAPVLPAVAELSPDAIVLDLMLPDGSGLDVLRALRRSAITTPVLILSAKGDLVDRVVGLELGADDYLPKPFALPELLARLRALLRRTGARPPRPSELRLGELRFDLLALTASSPEGPLPLTAHDVKVLKVLADHRGEVVPRLDIVEEVCGMESLSSARSVDNHVVALRRALGDDPRHPRWIETVRGVGYRLTPDRQGLTPR